MLSLNRQKIEIIFYFILLGVLVFLGDGKQAIVDVVAVAGVLCLWIIRTAQRRKTPPSDFYIHIAWIGMLVYFIVHTFFSDSIGFSISAIVRYIMAYIVFVHFSSAEVNDKNIRTYNNALLWFVGVCSGFSILAIMVPSIGAKLPTMNLLYPAFGHNYIATLIVFVFPLIVGRLLLKQNVINISMMLLAVGILVFSFARGAWVTVAAYLVFRLLFWRSHDRTKTRLVAALAAGFMGVIFLMGSSSRFLSREISQNSLLKRQLMKNSVIENRANYWKQALISIKQNPLFGTGPGTFYILSKRYQMAPESYSWYAHSFPLQILAETGLIGLLGVTGIFVLCLSRVIKKLKNDKERNPEVEFLISGSALTLLYSVYEINLDFLVVWLLLWGSLGMLVSYGPKNGKKLSPGLSLIMRTVTLGIVIVYYLLSVASVAAPLFTHNRLYPFLLKPYSTYEALTYLDYLNDKKLPLSDHRASLMSYFHRNNPEIAYEEAKLYTEPQNIKKVALLYEVAIENDPQNVQYFSSYVQYLLTVKEYEQVGLLLKNQAEKVILPESKQFLININFSSPSMLPLYTHKLFNDVGNPNTIREYLSKTYYFLGLAIVDTSPETARSLWTFARDSELGWGHFHVELAALYWTIFDDEKSAKKILTGCLRYETAKKQCESMKVNELELPGSLRENIRKIPNTH